MKVSLSARALPTIPMRKGVYWAGFTGLLLAATAAAGPLLPAVTEVGTASAERELQFAVKEMRGGQYEDALKDLQKLTEREPNFRLAQLLYGQLLGLRSGTSGTSPLSDDQDPRIKDLLDEYRVRIGEAQFSPPPGSLPNSILRLSGTDRHAIVVDLSRSRFYVLSSVNGQMHVIYDYYSTLARNGFGKQTAGDLRTPVGIYRTSGFTPGSALPAFYGAGAFPLNYPNSWDRMHGRTGSGIWLHGVPADTYARPPRASEGCVVLANEDLVTLKPIIVANETPVIFSDKVDWLAADKLAAQRSEIEKRIESWRERWSAKDTAGYLAFYADDFHTDDGMDRAKFAEYKKRVNDSKHSIEVTVVDLDLYSYPGEGGLALAEFTQDYRSDNFSNRGRKEQFWHKESDGQWKIVREENR